MTSLENVEHELNGRVLIQVKTAANMRDEAQSLLERFLTRLFTMEEVIGIRKKRIELQSSYNPPGH